MRFGGRLNWKRRERLWNSALATWSSGRVFYMRTTNSARYPICSALFLADEAAVRLLARLPSGASRMTCGTKTEEIRTGGRGRADRQAPRFAHYREDEGLVVGSQQSETRRSGKRRLCPVPAAGSYSPLFPRFDHAYHI